MCVCVCEWRDHSVRDAHSIPTLVGLATVGQCVESAFRSDSSYPKTIKKSNDRSFRASKCLN